MPEEFITKFKHYRKRAGLSQLELENAVGASSGTISRIESGKTNPTKETLLKIAEVLELKHIELNGLLGVLNISPSEEEINQIRGEVEEHFNSDAIAYLCDEWGYLYALSKGFRKLIGVDEKEAENVLGKNIILLTLDPKSEVGHIIDPKYVGRTIASVIKRLDQEVVLAGSKFFEELIKTPFFGEVSEYLKNMSRAEVMSANSKKIHLIVNGKKLRYTFTKEFYYPNPRFEVVEFINPEEY